MLTPHVGTRRDTTGHDWTQNGTLNDKKWESCGDNMGHNRTQHLNKVNLGL